MFYYPSGKLSDFLHDFDRDEGGKTLELEIPGVKKEDISLKLEGGILRLRGKGRRGSLHYNWKIPSGMKVKRGQLEDGILTVELEDREEGQEITIE